MTESLFLSFPCDRSRRTAVIAEEIDSIWLYLSAPGEQKPQRDCWLLNTTAVVHEQSYYRQRGAPPPAPADRVGPEGVASPPATERWSVQWSVDGHSVAALLDGLPIGVISATGRGGMARFIGTGADPWALPWDEDAYRAVFAQ